MKPSFLFIDEANLYRATKKRRWEIDWERFLAHLGTLFDIRAAYLYEGMPTKRSIKANISGATFEDIKRIQDKKRVRFRSLRQTGYIIRHKSVSTVDGENKCNFDVEIAVDAIDQAPNYEIFVLASGDGDFIRLVKYLRGLGKEVHVIGARKTNKELKREARGNFITLDGIRSYIEKH